jgi:hypothetical protein
MNTCIFGCRDPRVGTFVYDDYDKMGTFYTDTGESSIVHIGNADALQIYREMLAQGWVPLSNEEIEIIETTHMQRSNTNTNTTTTTNSRWIIVIVCIIIVCFLYYWFRLRG